MNFITLDLSVCSMTGAELDNCHRRVALLNGWECLFKKCLHVSFDKKGTNVNHDIFLYKMISLKSAKTDQKDA